jgi:hypothetical protein
MNEVCQYTRYANAAFFSYVNWNAFEVDQASFGLWVSFPTSHFTSTSMFQYVRLEA